TARTTAAMRAARTRPWSRLQATRSAAKAPPASAAPLLGISRRHGSGKSPSGAGRSIGNGQGHLARAEAQALALGADHDQVAAIVDAVGDAGAVLTLVPRPHPADLAPA